MVMFFKGYEGFELMRDSPRTPWWSMSSASSWFWTFHYPDEELSTDRALRAGETPVQVRI